MSKLKVIFLDRDGTLNRAEAGEFVHRVSDWQWLPGAVAALQQLQAAGFVLTVVTNQSGIGHGLYTEADMRAVHRHMVEQLTKSGVAIAAVAFCPHRRDAACHCRKPKTGMVHQIEKEIGPIAFGVSWAVGDKPSDVGFGLTLGTRTALIRSRHWKNGDLTLQPDVVADSLPEAASKIVSSLPASAAGPPERRIVD